MVSHPRTYSVPRLHRMSPVSSRIISKSPCLQHRAAQQRVERSADSHDETLYVVLIIGLVHKFLIDDIKIMKSEEEPYFRGLSIAFLGNQWCRGAALQFSALLKRDDLQRCLGIPGYGQGSKLTGSKKHMEWLWFYSTTYDSKNETIYTILYDVYDSV